MTIDEITKTLQAVPFQPFDIHVADGRSFPVKHPDFLLISPNRRTVYVYDTHAKACDIIDVRLVTTIHVPESLASVNPSP